MACACIHYECVYALYKSLFTCNQNEINDVKFAATTNHLFANYSWIILCISIVCCMQPLPDEDVPSFTKSLKALFDVMITLEMRILEVIARGLKLEASLNKTIPI